MLVAVVAVSGNDVVNVNTRIDLTDGRNIERLCAISVVVDS